MSWRLTFQQGSFRGVPFRTVDAGARGGRRLEIHEFAGRDETWPEDFGRVAKGFSFTCWVAGADYMAQRDALEKALDAPGAGTLINPFRGLFNVKVNSWECTENAGDGGGGIADYTIEFVIDPGAIVSPAAIDTGAQSRAAADKVQAAAPKQFAKKFSVKGVVAFVDKNAAKLVGEIAKVSAVVARVTDGVSQVIHSIEAGALLLVARAQELVRVPETLAQQVTGFVHTIGILGSSAARLGGLFELLDFGGDLPAVIGDTEARRRERANQDAIVHLVSLVAAAELVRTIAATDFASYQDAVAMRDRAADRLDVLMLRAADLGDDDGAAAFQDLRHALIRDVTARGGSLARLQTYTPLRTEPALVIAQRLYGADAELRAAEIVARNRIAHPGFVPGGQPLEILAPIGGGIDG